LALHSQLAEKAGTSDDSIPQWLSTHPDPENRAKKLDSLIPAVSVVDILIGFYCLSGVTDKRCNTTQYSSCLSA